MINFNEEAFINWANYGEVGSKEQYADYQPSQVPEVANLIRALVDRGCITVVSKKIPHISGKDKKAKWKAWAIKC